MENETPTTPAQEAPVDYSKIPANLVEFSLPINPEVFGIRAEENKDGYYPKPIWNDAVAWIKLSEDLRTGRWRK